MKGKSKPRSPRKKKNDSDKLEQLADKKARRREKKTRAQAAAEEVEAHRQNR